MDIGEGERKTASKKEESFRISVSQKVDTEMNDLLFRVNDGFKAGKVNRPQLVNWLISRACQNFSDSDLKAIRADHFDEFAMFEAIMRQAKENGKFPAEFKALMQKHIDDGNKKAKNSIEK
jgi:hypothetical protein